MNLFVIGDLCTFDDNNETVIIESVHFHDPKTGYAEYIVRNLNSGERDCTDGINLHPVSKPSTMFSK